jgi:hypothetical protein
MAAALEATGLRVIIPDMVNTFLWRK